MLWLGASHPARAQTTPAPPHTAGQPTPGAPYRLHVATQLVLLDASVTLAATGEPLRDLGAEDFRVFEEGQPQVLTTVSSASASPLSLVLLFDLTDTVQPVLQHLADGAAELLRQLRPEDEVAVMTFSSHTHLEQRFTHDRMAAREGLDAASASYERGEPTFVFEDLWEAAQVAAATRLPAARRVEVWVTDGSANDQEADRGRAHHAPAALHSEADATAAVLGSEVVVGVLLERSLLRGSGHFGDLEHFAELTGGPVVQATAADAAPRLTRLLEGLRSRYTLGYRPAQARPSGTFCRLRVELSPAFFQAHPGLRSRDVVIRARTGYLRTASLTP